MDFLKSELFYKFRNMIDSEYRKKDFSFYIHKSQIIAPLSFEILGEDFFKKTIPLYFKELVINQENLVENLFYFPLFFKKNIKKFRTEFGIEDYHVELLDYEFTKLSISEDLTPVKVSQYNEATSEVYLNPMAQALRHEYDVRAFEKLYLKNKKSTFQKNKTLLLISKNPAANELMFLKGNANHAAIIDELHDGKILRKDLLHILHLTHPAVTQSEWVIALNDLKSNFFVLEA